MQICDVLVAVVVWALTSYLQNGDYCAIIAVCSHSILLRNYTKGRTEGSPQNLMQRKKDLLLDIHVDLKSLKLEISPCRFADCVKK